MSRADELRAELEVAELEEALVAAKANGNDYADLKYDLREARRKHREQRAAGPAVDGDAVASPDTISASAAVQEK